MVKVIRQSSVTQEKQELTNYWEWNG